MLDARGTVDYWMWSNKDRRTLICITCHGTTHGQVQSVCLIDQVRPGKLLLLLLWIQSLSLLAYDDVGESLVVFQSSFSSSGLDAVVAFLLRGWRSLLLDFSCSRERTVHATYVLHLSPRTHLLSIGIYN